MTSSHYKNSNVENKTVVGGWISSLENLVKLMPDVFLGIVFYSNDTDERQIIDGVSYYPIKKSQKIIDKVRRATISKQTDEIDMLRIKDIVEEFKPDIIHVFGTESNFGKITYYTKIPVVIHIQGILNPYINAWFPPGFSKIDFFIHNGLNLKKSLFDMWIYLANIRMGKRELEIMKGCKYFMGRTEWDKNISSFISSNSTYFFCNEVLRPAFYLNDSFRINRSQDKFIIQSTISSPIYKGIDLILKTADLLISMSTIQFEWHIFGINDISFFEKKMQLKSSSLNIKLMGIASEMKLIDHLKKCDLFVHPSYIDNSPNSVCEAQIMGIPTIVTNVGGVSSLVKHGETGLIIPANDPFSLAYYIDYLSRNEDYSRMIAEEGRIIAKKRHEPNSIVNNLIANYQKIINHCNSDCSTQ